MNNEELFNLVIELKGEILSLKDEIKQLRQDLLNDAPSANIQMRDEVLNSIVRQNKTKPAPVTEPVTTTVVDTSVTAQVETPEPVKEDKPKLKNIFDI